MTSPALYTGRMKLLLVLSCTNGLVAVLLGAFGALPNAPALPASVASPVPRPGKSRRACALRSARRTNFRRP